MRKIMYFGNSIEMVNYLINSSYFSLGLWVSEKRFSESHDIFLNNNNINHVYVEKKHDLEEVVSTNTGFDCAIMYSFGIIVTSAVINKINVFNFHPGSLERNRGRNPIEWAILLGWEEDEMSLHKIDEGIDTGILIGKKIVKIDFNDTVSIVKRKMNDTIPYLLNVLDNYLSGIFEGVEIKPGIYRERITESDYTIDLEKDSIETIKNKLRSQQDYNGAIVVVDGEKHYVKTLDELYLLTGR